jgi:hypothetical protein
MEPIVQIHMSTGLIRIVKALGNIDQAADFLNAIYCRRPHTIELNENGFTVSGGEGSSFFSTQLYVADGFLADLVFKLICGHANLKSQAPRILVYGHEIGRLTEREAVRLGLEALCTLYVIERGQYLFDLLCRAADESICLGLSQMGTEIVALPRTVLEGHELVVEQRFMTVHLDHAATICDMARAYFSLSSQPLSLLRWN